VVQTAFPKNSFFFVKINFFLYVSDRFDVLISKMIFKKWKKHHFDAFFHEKHFKKQSQPHSQVRKATSFRERPKPNPKYLGWSGREWRRCSHGQVENKKSAILDWVFLQLRVSYHSWEFYVFVFSCCMLFPFVMLYISYLFEVPVVSY
jgi:hypothetical protein